MEWMDGRTLILIKQTTNKMTAIRCGATGGTLTEPTTVNHHCLAVRKFIEAADLLTTSGLYVCVAVAATKQVQFWASRSWRTDLEKVMRGAANLQADLDIENNDVEMFVKMSSETNKSWIPTGTQTKMKTIVLEEIKTDPEKERIQTAPITNHDEVIQLTNDPSSNCYETTKPAAATKDSATSADTVKHLCDICAFTTPNAAYLKIHMRKHTGDKPLKCEKCDFKTAHNKNLWLHKQCHANEEHKFVLRFQCEKCNYKAPTGTHLKRHMIRHSGEKPFACDLCDYKTIWKGGLVSHIKTHTPTDQLERPFHCAKCDFKSTTQCLLTRHMIVHTGDKPHVCEHCDFRSAWRNSIRAHTRRRHSEKKPPKPIPIKPDPDPTRDHHDYTIPVHKRQSKPYKITKILPFECKLCNFNTKEMNHLSEHIGLCHSDYDSE